ncbi:hypothetical protein ES703_59689 [subsurface metagenome]
MGFVGHLTIDNSLTGAALGASLALIAELSYSEFNWFIRHQGQVSKYLAQSHSGTKLWRNQ